MKLPLQFSPLTSRWPQLQWGVWDIKYRKKNSSESFPRVEFILTRSDLAGGPRCWNVQDLHDKTSSANSSQGISQTTKWHWTVCSTTGSGHFHNKALSDSTDLKHLCGLTWCRRPLGWKSHLDRFVWASRFRQTVLEIWKSTKYLEPLTIWNRQRMQWAWGEDGCKADKSYLPLRSDDGGRLEEERVVGLVVVQVGGVEEDLLEDGVILADVDRCSRNQVASWLICQRQRHLWASLTHPIRSQARVHRWKNWKQAERERVVFTCWFWSR